MWVAEDDMTLEGIGTGVAPAHTRRRRGIAAVLLVGELGERQPASDGWLKGEAKEDCRLTRRHAGRRAGHREHVRARLF